jgi:hypothetical protein
MGVIDPTITGVRKKRTAASMTAVSYLAYYTDEEQTLEILERIADEIEPLYEGRFDE